MKSKVYIEEIDNNLYKESKARVLFQEEQDSNKYAIVSNNIYEYKLSWHSQLINPDLVYIRPNIYSIGIDNYFAIIDFQNDKIALNLRLMYFYYKTIIYNNYIYLITELELIKIEILNLKELKRIFLPDIFVDITFNDKLEIKCANGETYYFNK
jgi:hypothetical protein